MLQIYLKIAFRALRREKAYVLINLLGFGAGIACFLVALLFLNNELKYDQHFVDHENIYRIATNRLVGDYSQYTSLSSSPVGPTLARDFPQVLSYANFSRLSPLELFREQGRSRDWENIFVANPDVFNLFNHTIIYGNPDTALQEPRSLAVSETFANFYFGTTNPVGEIISEAGVDYTITLVFEDLPGNTHLKYDALLSMESDPMLLDSQDRRILMWLMQSHYTYLKMVDGYDPSSFGLISEQYVDTYLSDFVSAADMNMSLSLEPLADIHYSSTTTRDRPRGNRSGAFALAAMAISVLAIACLNYVNLAAARSCKRANEVGMRKILGASNGQLVVQFLGESIALTMLASMLGLGIVYFASNFSSLGLLAGVGSDLQVLVNPAFLAWFLIAGVVLAIVSSLYPAFLLAATTPLQSVSNSKGSSSISMSFTGKTLFLQFLLSVTVLSFTLLMFQQLRYMDNKPLGYNQFNKITIQVKGVETIRRLPTLIAELEQHNDIHGATVTTDLASNFPLVSTPGVETNDGSFRSMIIYHVPGDSDFLDVMGVELLQGRNLDPADAEELGRTNLVNETLVREMGWDEPLGKRVGTWQVTGVVKDFHFRSMHEPIEPMVIRLDQENLATTNSITASRMRRTLVISAAGTNLPETLQFIEDRWSEFEPSQPFSFSLLDQDLKQLYLSDAQQARLIAIVAVLSILVSGLGLSIISAFHAEQNTKDIGIHKVLGAPSLHIVFLYFRRLIAPVIIASLLGSLISFWMIDRWLLGFSYRDDVDVTVFLISSLILLLVVLLTQGTQTARAARKNPDLSLRYE